MENNLDYCASFQMKSLEFNERIINCIDTRADLHTVYCPSGYNRILTEI